MGLFKKVVIADTFAFGQTAGFDTATTFKFNRSLGISSLSYKVSNYTLILVDTGYGYWNFFNV